VSIDFSTDHGKRALEELTLQPVVWLTTIGINDYPQPNLVWFIYEIDSIVIYTQPDAARLRHIRKHPHVSLNFNSDPEGHQQTVILGTIEQDASIPPVARNHAYVQKYSGAITGMGGTVDTFSEQYSVPLRVTLTGLRGF
jgi:PPOX class probable F420-dependent enzyme